MVAAFLGKYQILSKPQLDKLKNSYYMLQRKKDSVSVGVRGFKKDKR